MSREIKLRIWSNHYNDYVNAYTPAFGWGLAQWITGSNKLVGFDRENFNSQFVIEQFTGLVDKNGKEIYEGDIAQWNHGRTDIGLVVYSEYDPFGGYPNACFYGLRVSCFKGVCQFQSDDVYEVIGNVHHNPELLATEVTK